MISRGRLLALGGGRRAVFKIPDTLELTLILLVCWGSETVRRDGILRGASSELELGGSSGVLALEEESTEPGEVGLLSQNSSGVPGDSRSYWSAMIKTNSWEDYCFVGCFAMVGAVPNTIESRCDKWRHLPTGFLAWKRALRGDRKSCAMR